MSEGDRPDIRLVPEPGEDAQRVRPRLKKLRLLAILAPLSLLAVVSTVFGMMMAVASDLPALENEPQYRGDGPRNSVLLDSQGKPLGRLASDQNRIYVRYDQISSYMRAAVISVEDQRFQTNNGVDLRGIARAFIQDLINKRAAQGASTITQQFVKNALKAENKRTVFQKLREAALAYHLTRKWGKKKILQEYLNSIYFGNGAYGVEAAAETYFGNDPNYAGCGTQARPCASELQPQDAALLAGIIQNPSGYDPVAHPAAAAARRNVVLQKMLAQGYIDRAIYEQAVHEALPAPQQVRPPSLDVKAPYFASWVRQQLVDRYGAQRAFEGGLRIHTTIDLKLQQAAQQAVDNWLPPGSGPTAALVAIDNDTGEVRAMVSGTDDYRARPFNLATQGQRQPGSAFKPFILARALEDGIGPGSMWPSRKRQFCVVRTTHGCREAFVVNNFESTYTGARTLANALTYSDNAVFAAVGIKVGTERVAKLAERMGIRTPVSHNLAMTLGGLKQGVSPLDMAHAYETFEQRGLKVSGTLGSSDFGPVGIRWVDDKKGHRIATNRTRRDRILPTGVADTATQIMSTVVSQGTATKAAIGEFAAGKTGTTENYGDAWFVGFTHRLTVAVWVGYPDKLVPMKTDFRGGPVEGGTFPALIWHDFMVGANTVLDGYAAADRAKHGLPPQDQTDTTTDAPAQEPTVPSDTTATTPADTGGATGKAGGGAGTKSTKPAAPKQSAKPAPPPAPTPAPQPTPAPATPQGDGGSGGAEAGGAAAPSG